MILQSEYDAEIRRRRLKVFFIVLAIIAVVIVLYAAIKIGRDHFLLGNAPVKTDTAPVSSPEPTKTEFADRFPTDFPSDIPIEKDVKFTQSYSLDYPGQKQLSIVFPSTKTVKENYDLYKDFLEKQGWNISNKGENTNLSFLYATKENMEMNVTITDSTMLPPNVIPSDADPSQEEKPTPSSKSQVSVSVLRK
jgi:hypothetical protein